MAALWKGSIPFGLVNIPVQLFPAVRTGKGAVHFRQLRKKDLAPIRYERVSSADDAVVPWSDIVKGYEYAKNKFVVLTAAELKAAAPEASKTIRHPRLRQGSEHRPALLRHPVLFPSRPEWRKGVRATP